MKLFTSIILALIFGTSFGQNFHNDSIINKFIKNLTDKRVDTILIYENGCVGCETALVLLKDDSCFYYGEPKIYYVFWKTNGLTYASKISNYDCYEYDTIVYNLRLVWDLYFKNKIKIKKERILTPSYINNGDTLFVDIDHYTYSQIMVIDNKITFEFEINDFYFAKMIDDKYVNLNYTRNTKTFKKKLQIQIENEIKSIEDKRLINKTAYNKRHIP